MIPPHVCWTLWKERNARLFKEHNQKVARAWNIDHYIQLYPTKDAKSFDLSFQLHLDPIPTTLDGEGMGNPTYT